MARGEVNDLRAVSGGPSFAKYYLVPYLNYIRLGASPIESSWMPLPQQEHQVQLQPQRQHLPRPRQQEARSGGTRWRTSYSSSTRASSRLTWGCTSTSPAPGLLTELSDA